MTAVIRGQGDADERQAQQLAVQQLQGLVDRGLLQVDADRVTARASYDRGTLRVNGQPIFGAGG